MKGYISTIRRYSRYDGPGIRTTVFLKGCPLRCRWCSSPQTWTLKPNPVFLAAKCIGCGKCLEACEYGAIDMSGQRHRIIYDNCTACGKCAQACPPQAIRMDGKEMTAEEVVEVVRRDSSYYRSTGGGVTVSGGEILTQPDFTAEILRIAKDAGIHTCVETSGYGDWEKLEAILKQTKIAYIDLKHMDSERHKDLTGLPNDRIVENIKRAAASGLCRVVLDLPAIPGLNDTRENMKAMAEFMHSVGLKDLKYLNFHKLGQHEYEELGMEYPVKDLESNTPEKDEENKEYFRELGINIVTE